MKKPCNLGDVIRIVHTTSYGEHRFTALVTNVERATEFGGWYLTFVPCNRHDSVRCESGIFNVHDTPLKSGVQSIEVIGRQSACCIKELVNS